MKLEVTINVLLLATVGIICVQSQSSCPAGRRSCGRFECYDPSIESLEVCQNQTVNCKFGFHRCQGKCIRTNVDCNSCGLFEKKCGKACYNPNEGEECTTSQIVCKFGKKACGTFCYDPRSGESCNPRGPGPICGIGELPCGELCFKPHLGETCNVNGIVCNSGEKLCGDACYNEIAGESCNQYGSQQIICKSGEKLCGDACYKVFAGESCNSDNVICKNGEKACGFNCYIPSAGESCADRNVCRSWERACGNACFDRSTHKCVNSNSNQICRIDEFHCFGQICYNPSRGQKCFANDGLVCEAGKVPVRGRCRSRFSLW